MNPTHLLGVEIQRNRALKWLKLHQSTRSEEILVKRRMENCKPADTPMDPGTAKALMLLPTDDVPDPKIIAQWQSYGGDLIYLLKTRPDIYFTVNLLSRFLQNATEQHLKLAKNRPLRYLRKTTHYGLVFSPGDGEWILSGSSDSDLAGDLKTARSTMGHVLTLGQYGAVAAKCGLDRKICTSTGQAETYAMQALVKDTIWTRVLLSELGFPMNAPTPLLSDNAGVVKQSTKAINHTLVKHYRMAQAAIRNAVSNGVATVEGVDTKYNHSDMMTKALPATPFIRHQIQTMGPQDWS